MYQEKDFSSNAQKLANIEIQPATFDSMIQIVWLGCVITVCIQNRKCLIY